MSSGISTRERKTVNTKQGLDEDFVLSYHSLMVTQNKDDDEMVQVGIALRLSGGVDFYFNFRLVESSEAIPGKRVYTAVDADF